MVNEIKIIKEEKTSLKNRVESLELKINVLFMFMFSLFVIFVIVMRPRECENGVNFT